MNAIILNGFGGVDQFVFSELPIPAIGATEVLVRVKAISINPVDVKTRIGKGIAGRIKNEHPLILGWDISGIVTAVGRGVNTFSVGDEVFGMVNFPGHGKAYAEYVAVPASQLALKPATIRHEQAAAATLAALTAYQDLTQHATIRPGQRVLVHAASGGVGHFAIQLAKHLGAYVIGTSSAANRDFVMHLGADQHIDYRSERFEDVVYDLDFVLDTIGGDLINRSLDVVKPGGTLISIPTGLHDSANEKAKAKGVHSFFTMVQSNGNDMHALAKLMQQGILKPHVSQTFPFSEMAEAHKQVESGRTVGKVVVTL
ncbi:NADP-dependent oxidoreductase [Spirosoma sp. SC4-14]|uniref:NADP-dependent oxidoreductase n=1 Tax=Spirosoma sp. SC4-14 TaxID=3128900 RepID=UPI0030D27DB1